MSAGIVVGPCPGEESLDARRQEGRLVKGEAGKTGMLGSGSRPAHPRGPPWHSL